MSNSAGRNTSRHVTCTAPDLAVHHRFVAWSDAWSETELRAVMSWPGGDRRHADLNVFFVSTPAE